MSRSACALLAIALCRSAAAPLAAQSTPPDALTGAGIHEPSAVRTASGRPGPAYWQQRADYRIALTLDPVTSLVTGQEQITYKNNAPESLPELWLQVEQNICRPALPVPQVVEDLGDVFAGHVVRALEGGGQARPGPAGTAGPDKDSSPARDGP